LIGAVDALLRCRYHHGDEAAENQLRPHTSWTALQRGLAEVDASFNSKLPRDLPDRCAGLSDEERSASFKPRLRVTTKDLLMSSGQFVVGVPALAGSATLNRKRNPLPPEGGTPTMENIMFIRKFLRQTDRGLLFYRDEFVALIGPGQFLKLNAFGHYRLEVIDCRMLWFVHAQLDQLIKAPAIQKQLGVIDLKDHERALVWIDGRFHKILPPGQYAYWLGIKEVRVEVVDARTPRFEHEQFDTIVRASGADRLLTVYTVEPDEVGVLFIQGKVIGTVPAGRHAFWTGQQTVKVSTFSTREAVLDIPGQEILTADKVTLRLNAVASYRIVDPVKSISQIDDPKQALYRETQLALRTVIGNRELDVLLADKDAVGQELANLVRQRANSFGLEVQAIGIRDLILPGEMRELFNKVIEARKAAEANIIFRREEAAALRHQTNAAKMLAENPTLLRLRELETLEKVACKGELKIILGEKGLTDRVVNML
jgi:hypothetical protein